MAYTISNPTAAGLCKPGFVRCNGVCVDRQKDKNNGGMCGTICGGMKTCQSGVCSN